jgi:hypothetical protein
VRLPRVFASLAAIIAVSACSSDVAEMTSEAAGSRPASVTKRSVSALPNGKRVLTLHGLGYLERRCDGKRFATTWIALRATEEVTVEIAAMAPARATLHPGQGLATPLRRSKFHVWTIEQATKPQTVKARVRVAPSVCPFGFPATDVAVRATPN